MWFSLEAHQEHSNNVPYALPTFLAQNTHFLLPAAYISATHLSISWVYFILRGDELFLAKTVPTVHPTQITVLGSLITKADKAVICHHSTLDLSSPPSSSKVQSELITTNDKHLPECCNKIFTPYMSLALDNQWILIFPVPWHLLRLQKIQAISSCDLRQLFWVQVWLDQRVPYC